MNEPNKKGEVSPDADIANAATSAAKEFPLCTRWKRVSFWARFKLDGAGTGQVTLTIITSPDGKKFTTTAEQIHKLNATAAGTVEVISGALVLDVTGFGSPLKWTMENQGGAGITKENCFVMWRAAFDD